MTQVSARATLTKLITEFENEAKNLTEVDGWEWDENAKGRISAYEDVVDALTERIEELGLNGVIETRIHNVTPGRTVLIGFQGEPEEHKLIGVFPEEDPEARDQTAIFESLTPGEVTGSVYRWEAVTADGGNSWLWGDEVVKFYV